MVFTWFINSQHTAPTISYLTIVVVSGYNWSGYRGSCVPVCRFITVSIPSCAFDPLARSPHAITDNPHWRWTCVSRCAGVPLFACTDLQSVSAYFARYLGGVRTPTLPRQCGLLLSRLVTSCTLQYFSRAGVCCSRLYMSACLWIKRVKTLDTYLPYRVTYSNNRTKTFSIPRKSVLRNVEIYESYELDSSKVVETYSTTRISEFSEKCIRIVEWILVFCASTRQAIIVSNILNTV